MLLQEEDTLKDDWEQESEDETTTNAEESQTPSTESKYRVLSRVLNEALMPRDSCTFYL